MDLFTMDSKPKNKDIFRNTVKGMADGTLIKITSFTRQLRQLGATLSESSVERYARWSLKWFGIEFISRGKGCYQLKREV